jgi:hypothetical protein
MFPTNSTDVISAKIRILDCIVISAKIGTSDSTVISAKIVMLLVVRSAHQT